MSVLHHEYEYSVLCAHWTLWCTCSVLLYYHSVCPRVHCHHHATRDVILQMSHLGVMDLVVSNHSDLGLHGVQFRELLVLLFGTTSVFWGMHLSGAMGLPRRMPDAPDMYMHACSTPRSLHTTLWYSRLLDVLRHLIPRHHVDLWTQIHRDSESSWSSGPRDYWMY